MYCMFCHTSLVFCSSRTKKKSELNHIIKNTLEKNLDANHVFAQKHFEEEMNNPMKVVLTMQLTKKSFNVLSFENSKFLVQNVFLRRMLCH